MKIHITTDYAIRVIGYLIQNENEISSAVEMSENLGITYYYFIKMVTRLKKAGFIESIRGPIGGYRLAKHSADITLYDIIQTMEGDIHINRCLEDDRLCSKYCVNNQTCLIHNILEEVQNELIAVLKSKRISDIYKLKVSEHS